MAVIQWRKYPTEVNEKVRIIPVDVVLPAGVVATNMTIMAAKSTTGVALITESGSVLTWSMAGGTYQRYFITFPVIWDDEMFVLGSVDPQGKPSIAITLRDSVTLVESDTIYVGVTERGSDRIASEGDAFSDDFHDVLYGPANSVDRSKWSVTNPTLVSATPGASEMVFSSGFGVAEAKHQVRSNMMRGRFRVEFNGCSYSGPHANPASALRIGVLCFNEDEDGTISLAGDPNGGRLEIEFLSSLLATQINTRIDSVNQILTSAVTLPGGALTTVDHDYAVEFDGHRARFWMDNQLVVEYSDWIPLAGSRLFIVQVEGWHAAGTVNPGSSISLDRISVADDERIAIKALQPLPVGGGLTGTTALATEATLSDIEGDVDAQSFCVPGTNNEESVEVIADDLSHTVRALTANCTYHLVVQPSSGGDETWVLVKCGGAPAAGSISWCSSWGPYELRAAANSDVRVQRLNLLGTYTFSVRCARVN